MKKFFYSNFVNDRGYYWDVISEIVGRIITSNIRADMNVCEIGFAGGHFLEFLESEGYQKLTGIEIRKEQYEDTDKRFKAKNLRAKLINEDVFNINAKYDAIYSTGLIQCFDKEGRKRLIEHLSKMAGIAIFTVPVITQDRNIDSNESVAVAGCQEYCTDTLAYELSMFYDSVVCGIINHEVSKIEDDFLYFVCRTKKG